MYTVTDKKLCEVYPGFSENKEKYKKRIEAVTDGYKKVFGNEETAYF